MRTALLNTGTELLLGDVHDAHLEFIAREIFPLGLLIEERRTVPDGEAIRHALAELFSCCEILFVTGGLGPTSDDITRAATTFRIVFSSGDIGEFLAIVEALELCQQQRLMWPIYSDSRNANKWVLERKCQTHLAPDASNRQLFKLIRAAESWLSAHTYSNPILKWETEAWGEIPADYGRK